MQQRSIDNLICYDRDYTVPPFGMVNTGNICWCNSILQILLSLTSLTTIVLENETSFSNNPFATEYVKLLKAAVGATDLPPLISDSSPRILQAFITQCSKMKRRVTLGMSQECAEEGLTLFIEMFNNKHIELLFSNVYEQTITCSKCNKEISNNRDRSFNIKMFTNVQLVTAEMFCNYLHSHPSECGDTTCKECGHHMTCAYRDEKLKMLREVVVIIFNKYHIKTNIWFPDSLTFPSLDGGSINYKLMGKVEHSGTMQGGHYWAHAYRDGVVKCFNDTSVTEGNLNPTGETFIVVYHLIK